VLAALPSFDPFLLRERLRSLGHEPARIYFDLAEADVERMRLFVGKEINQLISVAFATGGKEAGALSQRLADKLMTDEGAKALDPLRETLRLSGADYIEGVFAWKGFLYYKWRMSEFKPTLEVFRPRFAGLRVSQATPDQQRVLAEKRRKILEQMDAALARVEDLLLEYGSAFAELAEGKPAASALSCFQRPRCSSPLARRSASSSISIPSGVSGSRIWARRACRLMRRAKCCTSSNSRSAASSLCETPKAGSCG
jgi:hypothetical protein